MSPNYQHIIMNLFSIKGLSQVSLRKISLLFRLLTTKIHIEIHKNEIVNNFRFI